MSGDEIPDRSHGALQFLWGGGLDSKLYPTEHPIAGNLFGRTAVSSSFVISFPLSSMIVYCLLTEGGFRRGLL
jgi:hypothetical protein